MCFWIERVCTSGVLKHGDKGDTRGMKNDKAADHDHCSSHYLKLGQGKTEDKRQTKCGN